MRFQIFLLIFKMETGTELRKARNKKTKKGEKVMKSKLAESFFNSRRETLISSENPNALLICKILQKGIRKGEYIQRGGRPTLYVFNFDLIYT